MTRPYDGGPAFPQSQIKPNSRGVLYPDHMPGMSLRDAAALAALPAIIEACRRDTREADETMEQMLARRAWVIADAFIEAREGKP